MFSMETALKRINVLLVNIYVLCKMSSKGSEC